nr:non-ribosomal peptide synthetase [Lysobacter spongiae]
MVGQASNPSRDGIGEAVDYDPFAGGPIERVVPTTEPQRELWLASRLGDEASLAYNESVSLHFDGDLDRVALARVLASLYRRHDALRACFGADGETMCVAQAGAFETAEHDFTALDADALARAVDERLRASVDTPFDLLHGPLFRAELLCLPGGRHRLVLSAHHIVCDGWSWWVMVRELGSLYAQAIGHGGEPLPAPVAFSDYAMSRGDAAATAFLAADEAFWTSRFKDGAPVLELPLDRPRPVRRTSASRRYDHVFDADLLREVRQMGARRGSSLFATLLAGFAGLMARLSAQEDVVVGIPAAGQSVDGHGGLVGHCVNLLPLRFAIAPEAPFEALLGSAQGVLLDALDHQRYTFGTLLQRLRLARDPARLPLVSVMFNIDQALDQESNRFPGLGLEFDCNPRSHENFELSINAVQAHGELRLECQYNTDLFDEATIRRWMSAYEAMLRQATRQPGTALAALELLDGPARMELSALQPAAVGRDREQRMHEYFERQCDLAPHRIALRHGDTEWDYRTLESRANRVAHLLRQHGVHAGSLVGLALERGPDMVACLLGVLKAGAGYVPLDPKFPADRLAYMAGDAGLAALLTQQASAPVFDLRGRPVLVMEQIEAQLAAMPDTRLGRDPQAAGPDSVAYVIYTSGSTGRPKGVQVPHGAVGNFLVAMQREPGLAADDRLLAVTTLSFDIAVLELMLPLSVGAAVVMADRDTAMDGEALARLARDAGVTCMQATPSTWRLLVEAGWQGGEGFVALCGGEPLPPDLAGELLARTGALWNMYGPTETTVWSTCARVSADARGRPDIHIGRPVANTRVWILDARARPCPRGVPGEICIAGEGVTLGYLQRPELTADRFVDVEGLPVADGVTEHLYRTGDLGRWRPDGMLEHLGRLDHQVKVRGYRIELGEIESVLANHPAVSRAVVVVREDRPGDVRLVAYVVADAGTVADDAGLKAHLAQTLPEYMLPQHFIALAAIPLLPNGKIDRRALPAPLAAEAPVARIAPRSPTEATIATAMAGMLGLERIGVEDDFFAHGGHSLIAARLVSRINRELDASLTLRSLFDAPTVARLAMLVDGAGAAPAASARGEIQARADQQRAPLSPVQERLWVLEQMQPGRVTYNTPSAHRLRGPLDHAAFERAFQAMVCRQTSLRTVIVLDDGGPCQRVRDDIDAALPIHDLSTLDEGDREPALRERMEALIAEPFDLERGPLFVARLYRLSERDHVLFFMTHHVIWDGWSFDVFYTEMSALYEAFRKGEPPALPPLRLSYGDVAAWYQEWLRGEALDRQLDFWKEHLAGALEPLRLPLDKPRPPEASGAGDIEWLSIDRATADAARALGTRSDATLFMVLLSTYYLFLHRLSGQDDLVVGLPVRNRDSEELESIMGFFVNMLPVRLRITRGMPFQALLGQVRRAVLDAFSHPDVPFDRLLQALDVPRDPSHAPIYQSSFSFQDVRMRRTHWAELEHEHLLVFQKASAGDLGLWFLEHGQGLSGVMSFNTDVLTAASARLFNQRFCSLLKAVIATPDMPVDTLDAQCEADRDLARIANATWRELPEEPTVGRWLSGRASAWASRPAVRFGDVAWTHGRLHERSLRIAACLRALGARRDSRVGICMHRGPDMVAAMLAALRLGVAYVPMDPDYPRDRLQFMVDDARLALIVSEAGLCTALELPHTRVFEVDTEAALLARTDPLPETTDLAAPDSVAYVIYTSGSTGRPKGVQVPHRAVVNFLQSMQHAPGLEAGDRLLAVTTTSFDIAVLELFLPLAVGAETVLADRDTAVDAFELASLLDSSGATFMQATPSTWRMLVGTGWRPAGTFKALCGGEPLAPDLADALRGCCSEVWNMYGPTETTVWSTCWKVQPDEAGISIGVPIDNTTVHVLDAAMQPCPPGVSGEICIGGAGVALGYLDRPELTAEKFIADAFGGEGAQSGPGRLYRTGDRGRWRSDGMLEHQGRFDHQVKLRGHRIELGEIEAALMAHDSVSRTVVATREDRPGDVRLVAYVVPATHQAVSTQALGEYLRARLPVYMLPQHIVVLGSLPLLPNGKIDRHALPSPNPADEARAATGADAGSPVAAPAPDAAVAARPDGRLSATARPARHASSASARVRYLMGVWEELLGVDVLATDNFFDLGGHSMLAVQMANRVARDTGVRLKLMRLASLSLEQVAEALPDMDASVELGEDPVPQPFLSRLRRRVERWMGKGAKAAP